MAKRFRLLTRPVVTLALIALAAGHHAAHAQSRLTGVWSAYVFQEKSEQPDKPNNDLDLNVERMCPTEPLLTGDGVVTPFVKPIQKYPFCSMGQSHLRWRIEGGVGNRVRFYDFSELQGLSREQALAGGAVKFSLVREAGTLEFEGSFQNGRGLGPRPLQGESELRLVDEEPRLRL